MNYKKWVIGLVAFGVAVSMTACGSVDKIMTQIDQGNYEEALDILDSKNLKDKDLDQLTEEMKIRIENGVKAYASNEISYEELNELMSTAYSMDLPDLIPVLVTAEEDIAELLSSKNAYQSGLEAFNDEYYESAYNWFGQVIENDGYYTEAAGYMDKCVQSYCDQIKTQVDEYLADKKYDDALHYLYQKKTSGAFSDKIIEMVDELTDDIRVQSILEEAQGYVDEDDIASALTLISDSQEEYDLKDNEELKKYVDSISKDYIDMIMGKVNTLCDEENYILALKMLSDAQEVIEADEFAKAVEEINKVKPTYLYDLKYSTSNRFEVVDSGDPLMDTIGNTYQVGNLFTISGSGGWTSEEGSVEYNLGYNRTVLTGVVSVDDSSDDTTAVLKIEGDGVVLQSIPLSRTTTPTPITVDVSNVNWLKISVVEAESGTITAILSDFLFDKKGVDVPAASDAGDGDAEQPEEAEEGEEAETEAAEEETADKETEAEEDTTAAEE